jgi:hypothetical protein
MGICTIDRESVSHSKMLCHVVIANTGSDVRLQKKCFIETCESILENNVSLNYMAKVYAIK